MKIFNIRACPFCGMVPHVSYCIDYSVIHCTCGAHGPEVRNPSKTEDRIAVAVSQWNMRHNGKANQIFEYTYHDIVNG